MVVLPEVPISGPELVSDTVRFESSNGKEGPAINGLSVQFEVDGSTENSQHTALYLLAGGSSGVGISAADFRCVFACSSRISELHQSYRSADVFRRAMIKRTEPAADTAGAWRSVKILERHGVSI